VVSLVLLLAVRQTIWVLTVSIESLCDLRVIRDGGVVVVKTIEIDGTTTRTVLQMVGNVVKHLTDCHHSTVDNSMWETNTPNIGRLVSLLQDADEILAQPDVFLDVLLIIAVNDITDEEPNELKILLVVQVVGIAANESLFVKEAHLKGKESLGR
jgi:hypothetical protein